MKRIILSAIIGAIIVSCGEVKREPPKKISWYSTESDTTYKINSTEIDEITRTFFVKPQTVYAEVRISKVLGKNKYMIIAKEVEDYELKSFTSIDLSEKNFEKLLSVIDTILKYKNRDLKYTVDEAFISGFGMGEEVVYLKSRIETGMTDGALIKITPRERDSIRMAYERFKDEN